MCLALAHGMLANVIQAEILKEIRAHFAYAWKIWDCHVNEADLAYWKLREHM